MTTTTARTPWPVAQIVVVMSMMKGMPSVVADIPRLIARPAFRGHATGVADMITITKTDREYRGWSISYDPPPIPWRGADWTATHPDYDAWTEDGSWTDNGKSVIASSLAELMREIDAWIEENEG